MHPIIRQVVDRLHVSASGRDVVRALRKAFARKYRYAKSHKQARKNIYRQGIKLHKQNRAEYVAIMRGNL